VIFFTHISFFLHEILAVTIYAKFITLLFLNQSNTHLYGLSQSIKLINQTVNRPGLIQFNVILFKFINFMILI